MSDDPAQPKPKRERMRPCELCRKRPGQIHLKLWVLKTHPPFLVDGRLCRECRATFAHPLLAAIALNESRIGDNLIAMAGLSDDAEK